MRNQQRQGRRRDAIKPAGLSDGAWSGGLQPLPDLVGEAAQLGIIDAVRQLQALIAAIGGNVVGLTRKIDLVFRVDLELHSDLGRQVRKAGPNTRELRDADAWMRQQFISAAPSAILVDRD